MERSVEVLATILSGVLGFSHILCFANTASVCDSPTRTSHCRPTKMAIVRMTLVPIAIGDAHRSRPRQRLPFGRIERNDSIFTAPAVRRLQAIQFSAAAGRRSFACLCGREGDPECKVSQDMRVGPRHAHLTARIASTQAAGRTKLGDTYWETDRRCHRPTRTLTAVGYSIRTGGGDSR
jgi:hypothetical protein